MFTSNFVQQLIPMMTLNNMTIAWDLFKSTYHQSHQQLLRYVQAILLLFIMTLSQTSNSIQDFLSGNLQGLLGADLVISQTQPLSESDFSFLNNNAEAIVSTQQTSLTLSHQDKWQAVNVKAVGNDYPLQGQLLTASQPHQAGVNTIGAPKSGHIWLDERIYGSLSLNIGDTLNIAGHEFVANKVLIHEPDRLMEGHTVKMRAIINAVDLAKLNISSELMTFRYLIAAEANQVSTMIDWQEQQLPAAQVFHKKGHHPLARFWLRTENFIGLASIILFFMAAIAVNQLSQLHSQKAQHFSAICLSVGATRWSGFSISFYQWLFGILLLLPVVSVASFALHWLFVYWLSDQFVGLVWQPQMAEAFISAGFVVSLFLVFHLPVWLKLATSSVGGLLHSGHQGNQSTNKVFKGKWQEKLISVGASVLVISLVILAYADNVLLTAMLITAIACCIAVILVLNWAFLTFGEKLTQRVSGLIPFSLFMMKQRLTSKSTQVLGVGLCAFLLLFTLMLLNDLGKTMSAYQRTHDGNVVISQATETQMGAIEQWAGEQGVSIRQSKSYFQAKLIRINELSLTDFTDEPSESLATLSQAVRLHWTDEIPANNRVVEGQWWQESQSVDQDKLVAKHDWQQVSVEEEIMTDLGLKIGDKLTLAVGSGTYDFVIRASHVFKSGGGTMTFWLQVPGSAHAQIDAMAYTMASLELSEQHWSLLPKLWQQYPTLRMISLKEMTERFDQMLAMVTKVISGFSLLISLLATLVIFASVKAVETKEKRKNSIIMSFGFSKAICFRLNIIEWLTTAIIAALGAISGTYIAGLLIYKSQFSLTYQPDFSVLLLTLSIILSVVCLLGLYASKESLKSSIRQLMAEV